MGRVVVLGAAAALRGWPLAGVATVEAADADAVRREWDRLGSDTVLAVLTPEAARALGPALSARPVVVLPE
ncbi:hypothetical protein [Amycolatopsis benzoatilytica]|uniref:hypothetical protein n=1 Tax=Amycolatopsis benzoatilytica TaxID=346045 RepID=UPI00037F25D3|nr:hypothetical protein [Amycolatopsis benzoatilytica]